MGGFISRHCVTTTRHCRTGKGAAYLSPSTVWGVINLAIAMTKQADLVHTLRVRPRDHKAKSEEDTTRQTALHEF